VAREFMTNPFDRLHDADRHAIWHMLVEAESDAFTLGDWPAIEPAFDPATFEGMRAMNSPNPDQWKIVFPTLAGYRESWLEASREWRKKRFVGHSQREALYARTRLTQIDITGDRALAHKKFLGDLKLEDGSTLSGARQTLFRLHKQNGPWKIVGFIGQLPLELGR
jgi:hypothetical protein